MDSAQWTPAKYYALIFLVAFLIYLPTTFRPLRDAESKYAEIPREMLVSGHWLTPQLNFGSYYEKPPLTFWVTASFYKIFGVTEWAARLANFLWAILTALLVGLLTSKMFGRSQGYWAAALFLLTEEVFAYCLDAGIEFGLVSLITLSMFFFWDFYQKRSLASLCLFYVAMGLGFMAKALPGIAIPGGVAVIFLLLRKEWKTLPRLFHPLAILCLAVVVAPWIIAMLTEHPHFFQVFIVNEHIRRLLGTMVSNDALFPTSLWLGLVAGEFFPWIVYLPLVTLCLLRMVRAGAVASAKVLFLLVWAAVPLLLYATARSKVDCYGLEVYPPLIILLSIAVRDVLDKREFSSSQSWAYPWCIMTPVALLAMVLLYFLKDRAIVRELEIPSLSAAFVFLAAAFFLGLGMVWSFLKGRPRLGFLGIALLMVVFFYCNEAMFIATFPYDSMKFAADTFNQTAPAGSILITDERPEFEHVAVLDFYAKRPILLLKNEKGSILHFIEKDRQAMCIDEAQLKQMTQGAHAIYLVGVTQKTRTRLARLKIPYQILAASGNRSLFVLNSSKR